MWEKRVGGGGGVAGWGEGGDNLGQVGKEKNSKKKGATVLAGQAAVEEEEKVTGLDDITSCPVLLLTASQQRRSDGASGIFTRSSSCLENTAEDREERR